MQAIIPWEPGVFPTELVEELNRRKTNRGFEYVKATDVENWSDYKGPMTPWVRFCSNGAGRINPYEGSEYYDKQGFILSGGKEFYSSYGFSNIGHFGQDVNNNGIIGYMPNGIPHVIENDIKTSNYPIHVPPPEIERISVTIQKELYRRASIEWVCFSAKQLEYMTPYFLVPGITCILEWGWNHFNPSSLIDLDNIELLKKLKKDPYQLYTDHILGSHGNYDFLFGVVTMFEWSIDGNKIKCKTEITSPDRLYAGLSIQSNITSNVSPRDKSKSNELDNIEKQNIQIETSLKSLVAQFLPKIREISNVNVSDDADIKLKFDKPDDTDFRDFIAYVKENNPDTYDEILYGVYYGKDVKRMETFIKDEHYYGDVVPNVNSGPTKDSSNKDKDFYVGDNSNVWINMGLLIEILNYKCDSLKFFNNDAIFKIDIGDCVIGGHQNLISAKGDDVLIPNANAPKYFYGTYGSIGSSIKVIDQKNTKAEITPKQTLSLSLSEQASLLKKLNDKIEIDKSNALIATDAYDELKNASHTIPLRYTTKKELIENGQAADYRVYSTCTQTKRVVRRDNLDFIINALRYSKIINDVSYEFPFNSPQSSGNSKTKPYPANISGYLKNIYFSILKLGEICKESKTFADVITKVLETISTSCGNFWDFKLTNSTGQLNNKRKKSASAMTIVDYRFVSSINEGKVYTFDWFDADSLLQSVKFTPTISDAQTIRTMYAETNNPQNRTILSGQNELLDYHFKDRLLLADQTKYKTPKSHTSSTHISMMKTLQNISPPPKAFQVTTTAHGKPLVCRLAIPPQYSEFLTLLLDDEDLENNPRYTGIMPGIQAQFTIQGVGGLRTFMMFLVRNLPEPYSHENIVFRIIDLTETIEGGKWTTVITAGIIPLRTQLKNRLGITPNDS